MIRLALWTCLLASPQEELPDPAKAWMGSWEVVEDANVHRLGRFVRFEAEKCALFNDGRLFFLKVKYAPDRIRFKFGSQIIEVQATLKHARLVLSREGDTPRVYRRLTDVPDELQLKPAPLGKPASLSPDRIAEVQKELARREKEDQAVRTDPARQKDMAAVDSANTSWLLKLLSETGWIDAPRFGARAAHAAFLLVQHSGNLSLMTTALPEIEKDVRAGRLDGQPYALLYDRVKIFLGERQRYGTQMSQTADGELVVDALEDRENVDRFRKELGMVPLSTYLSYFKSPKPPRFEDDDWR